MAEEVLEHYQEGVVTLTLNRPAARNALTELMLDELHSALMRAELDAEIRVVVLTGAGTSFCAGGDIKSVVDRANMPSTDRIDIERRVLLLRRRMEISRLLHEMPKPTVALIGGAAAGAGFSLALACDFRLMADEACLLTAFSSIGLSGDFGGSYFLTHLVGAAKARELYFKGCRLTGKEAETLGIVNRSVPASELTTVACDYLKDLIRIPASAIGYIKGNLNLAQTATLSQVLDQEAAYMVFSSLAEGHRAAVDKFLASGTSVLA